MHDSIRAPGQGARTFLVHLLGGGLADIRYAVTHFRSRADGDIVPVHPEGSTGKGRPRPSIMTLDKVRELCAGTGRDHHRDRDRAAGLRHAGLGHPRQRHRLRPPAQGLSGDRGIP